MQMRDLRDTCISHLPSSIPHFLSDHISLRNTPLIMTMNSRILKRPWTYIQAKIVHQTIYISPKLYHKPPAPSLFLSDKDPQITYIP